MRVLKLAALTAATLLMGLATAGGAHAAYVDPAINVSVDDATQVEGNTFTVRASSEADCSWTVTFEGSSKEDEGTSISATFTAPQVSERTEFPAIVSCAYDDTEPIVAPEEPEPDAVTPAAIQTVTRTVTITVLPTGASGDGSDNSDGSDDSDDSDALSGGDTSDSGGLLPMTGGTSVDLLWIGGALVVAGAATTVAVRRRRHA